MNDSLSLIPICSQPSAQRHVRMEEIVQLQTPAAVLVVGLETHVVKVCEMHADIVTVQHVLAVVASPMQNIYLFFNSI